MLINFIHIIIISLPGTYTPFLFLVIKLQATTNVAVLQSIRGNENNHAASLDIFHDVQISRRECENAHYDSATRVTQNLSTIVNVTCFSREHVLFACIYSWSRGRIRWQSQSLSGLPPFTLKMYALYFSDEKSRTRREKLLAIAENVHVYFTRQLKTQHLRDARKNTATNITE